MRRPPRYGQWGLTLLLEALLGLSLISIVLLLIFQLFPVSDRSVGLADRTTQANHMARALMEKQLDTPYEDLVVGVTEGESVLSGHTQRRGQTLSTTYVWKVEISADPDSDPDLELRNILVTVSWKEGGADAERASTVNLQSVRGNLW